MKRTSLLALALASLALFPSLKPAQAETTAPVGFTSTSLRGESDSAISLPFVRTSAFLGSVQSTSGDTITVSGSPWTANQFVYVAGSQSNRYYALIGPATGANAKEGHTYPIIGNGTNTLTVELGPDDLVGIPASAQVSVIPNWTLKTVFPAANQNVSFTPTVSTSAYKTQIRVPNPSLAGINLPVATYYFSNDAWRLEGDGSTDRGDDPLLPDSYFIVRNLNGAPTLPLLTVGGVLLKKLTVPLITSASAQQDNPVSLLRPLGVALNATGLNRGDGSFVASDELLVFDNTQIGYDKTPAIYFVDPAVPNGPWRLAGDNATDRGGDIIAAGTGFIIRKAPTGSGQPAFWTNSFPVQAAKAVSRKTHGSAGDFDLDLPLSGTPGIECRGGGTDHKIVFTFPTPVTYTNVTVTSGNTASASAVASGTNEVTVNLSGVANAQAITVTLLGVNDGTNANDIAVRMAVLAGDTTGNGSVNGSDIGQVKAQSGQAVNAGNFRQDVNLSGDINASDIAFVKAQSGSVLP